ncbi:MAG: YdcF family protein, partial [Pseudomonadales bacterium]|nr:YdcF family protein [Pseudomonadales bacterium]
MLYRTLLKFWLLPPVINVLLVLAGLVLLRRYRKTGIGCIFLGLASLLALAMPQVSNQLLKSVEVAGALDESQVQRLAAPAVNKAGPAGRIAIVMLGAGHVELADEYGDAYPEKAGVARVNYAAYLHRQTGLPIMLTGGTPRHSSHAHADVLARYLQRHFDITPAWREIESRTTWENAYNAAAILLPENIETVVLVTQSLHMRRAIRLFEAAGFNVIPAPTDLSFASAPAAQTWRW